MDQQVIIFIPNNPTVPVAMDNIWPEVQQNGQMCWKSHRLGYQGEELIGGAYMDYVVDHIFGAPKAPLYCFQI